MFNLDPIAAKLARPEFLNLQRVASSGIHLRMAAVALESGQLHYITGRGQVLHAGGGDHFYTVLADERDFAFGVGYVSEGTACYVFPTPTPDTIPLYRLLSTASRQTVDPLAGVLASAAIPATFPAVPLLDENYVDGGVREILPIKAAIEAGATQIYAVAAGAEITPSDKSFSGANLIDVGLRAVEQIMTDETIRNEISPPGGWGVPIVSIRPTVTVHDILTIEPGRISIAMAYGYMRAFDAVEFPGDQSVWRSSDEITLLRTEIWQLEFYANGKRDAPLKGKLRPTPDPDALRLVRQKKRELKKLVDDRRALVSRKRGGDHHDSVPGNVQNWWRQWERHNWDPFILSPWDEFVSNAGSVDAEQAP